MSQLLLTNVLDKSPFVLLTLSVSLVGYFRTVPIKLLLDKLKICDDEIKKLINNAPESGFAKLTNNSAKRILIKRENKKFKELIDRQRKIHIQLILLNLFQIVLAFLCLLIVGRFCHGNVLDIWIQTLLLGLTFSLLIFHLCTNSPYIFKSLDALKKISCDNN